jgi:hypothetical protein
MTNGETPCRDSSKNAGGSSAASKAVLSTPGIFIGSTLHDGAMTRCWRSAAAFPAVPPDEYVQVDPEF